MDTPATAPKSPPAMYVRVDTRDKLRTIATRTRRSLAETLDMLADEWLEANPEKPAQANVGP